MVLLVLVHKCVQMCDVYANVSCPATIDSEPLFEFTITTMQKIENFNTYLATRG